MFGKRKRTWSRNKKEKQLLKTRLIEISIKVEDCIYHKKSISEAEAQNYIIEVTSYKEECSGDERSLQVIDKLTRCMKAIIAEHQELRANDGSTNDENSFLDNDVYRPSSPVYSLPDEDRTEFTQEDVQIHVAADAINNDTRCNDVGNKSQFQQDITDENNQDTKINNLCGDNELFTANNNSTNKEVTSNIYADIDMQNAISNLSLQDKDEDNILSGEGDCSQSILNNYNEMDSTQRKNICNNDIVPMDNDIEFVGSYVLKDIQDHNMKLTKPVIVSAPIKIVKPIHFTLPTDIESSQSILNNYKEIDTGSNNESNNIDSVGNSNVTHKPAMDQNYLVKQNLELTNCINVVNPLIIKRSNINDKEGSNLKIVSVPLVTQSSKAIHYTLNDKTQTATNQTRSNLHSVVHENASKITMSTYYSQQKCIPVEYRKTQSNNTTANTSNLYTSQNELANPVNNLSKHITAKTKLQVNIDSESTQTTIKKKRNTRKKKITEVKNRAIVKTVDSTIISLDDVGKKVETGLKRKQTNKRNNKSNDIKNDSIPIYNKNVVNDLSWLENIRYVREVTADEFDSSLSLGEDFWNNYYLPPYFDENDFL